MDWETCPAVERNPGKIGGAWAFTGTRVPVYALFENLAGIRPAFGDPPPRGQSVEQRGDGGGVAARRPDQTTGGSKPSSARSGSRNSG